MKKFFKRAAAGLVAVGFATVTFTANLPTAQSFGLGDIAGGVGSIFGGRCSEQAGCLPPS